MAQYSNKGKAPFNPRGGRGDRGGMNFYNLRPISQLFGKPGHVVVACYHRFDPNWFVQNQNQYSTSRTTMQSQYPPLPPGHSAHIGTLLLQNLFIIVTGTWIVKLPITSPITLARHNLDQNWYFRDNINRLEHLDEILRNAQLSGYLYLRRRWSTLPGEPPPINDCEVDDWYPRFLVLHKSSIYLYVSSSDLSPQDTMLLSDDVEVGLLPNITQENEEIRYCFYILTRHGLRYECSSFFKLRVDSWLAALGEECKLRTEFEDLANARETW